MQVMKNLVQPYFKGRTEEWPKFTIDWDLYLAELSAGGNISDELKLQLFEPCLNETERGELQFMILISAGQLTFQQFFWPNWLLDMGRKQMLVLGEGGVN